MTCIVGVKKNGIVYIGGDSAGVLGLDVELRADPKVFTVGEFVIGCTTSFRMIQLLRFSFYPPRLDQDADVYKYMCTDFVDAVRECFEAGGYMGTDKESREDGGTFLIGVRDRLFKIEDDFQVGEMLDCIDSVGCGSSYAIGALEVLATGDFDPEAVINKALDVAVKRSGGVLPPYVLISTADAKNNLIFEKSKGKKWKKYKKVLKILGKWS